MDTNERTVRPDGWALMAHAVLYDAGPLLSSAHAELVWLTYGGGELCWCGPWEPTAAGWRRPYIETPEED